ncbi:amidohydrolase family protein [Cupriavidus basilensis]|uniref:Amidohydrolase family protein n=1 Tax=Cupriavidus basilensis TaxID=68895 RepID=A0ABT6AYD4_9BURK|nr:amidohydrolase family protein [Cupriavidus basilensis]MDF3836696.1 amidohydrolase family protein [Cupriavidus basilensis]
MTKPMHRHTEVALEPELPIIDTHHHLWPEKLVTVSSAGGPGQQVGQGAPLHQWTPYSLDDFGRDVAGGHNIVKTVYLECFSNYRTEGPAHVRPVGEVEWVMSQVSDDRLMSGIIGHADMTLGADVGEVLDAHRAAGGARFKGIRHSVSWDPNPGVYYTPRKPPAGLLLNDAFGKGVAELSRRGLIFETLRYFHQLSELSMLARAHPDLTIVLCHLGGPAATGPYERRRAEVMAEWSAGLKKVAEHHNIVLKLGGIGRRAAAEQKLFDGPRSSEHIAAYWGPELRFCIETLGPDRCMFESNFPVDRKLCDYVTLWNVFKRITSDLSPAERRCLFEGTARRTYRL